MAGAGIRIDAKIDDREVRRAVRRLQRWVSDLTPVMQDIGGNLEASVINRFERERGPDDEKWPKSARAKAEQGQTLTDTARLRNSINSHASRTRAVVGTNVKYAAIHQFGGKTRPSIIRPRHGRALFWRGAAHPVAQVKHPGSVIPARPFLGIGSGDLKVIGSVLERHLQEAMA